MSGVWGFALGPQRLSQPIRETAILAWAENEGELVLSHYDPRKMRSWDKAHKKPHEKSAF
jgi:hypothetical protein